MGSLTNLLWRHCSIHLHQLNRFSSRTGKCSSFSAVSKASSSNLAYLFIHLLFRQIDTVIMAATMYPRPQQLWQNVILKFSNLKVTKWFSFVLSVFILLALNVKNLFSGPQWKETMFFLEQREQKQVSF